MKLLGMLSVLMLLQSWHVQGEGDGTSTTTSGTTTTTTTTTATSSSSTSEDDKIVKPVAIYEGLKSKRFAAIIDVRTATEFATGHLPNATLVESLTYYGNPSQITTPEDLAGCEACPLLIYDRAGTRARVAIEILQKAGFTNLYNGQGVEQWTAAGYDLIVNAVSQPALCVVNKGTCTAKQQKNETKDAGTTPGVVSDSTAAEGSSAASFHGTTTAVSLASIVTMVGLLMGN